MESAFRRFESALEPPELVAWRDGYVLRYRTQSIEQALLQKLARLISGLHAAHRLLAEGFVQEQAVIHRTLDEIGEDITFLAAARTNGDVTPLHDRYLKAFFEDQLPERWDRNAVVRGPDMPTRSKIRAYLTRVLGEGIEPSNADATLHRAYSGYVHAASQNIMDMCGGFPPRYHLRGLQGTPRVIEHEADSWNYLYRGFLSTIIVAKAFGDELGVKTLYEALPAFKAFIESGGPWEGT